jgi:hypothetical protein
VWEWAVQYRCLLLFLICFVLFDPFSRKLGATGFVVIVSENLKLNLLMFSGGMGFSILGLLLFSVDRCFFAMMLFGGISRHIG